MVVIGLGACAIALLTARHIARAVAAVCTNCILTLPLAQSNSAPDPIQAFFCLGRRYGRTIEHGRDGWLLFFGVDTSAGNPRHWKR